MNNMLVISVVVLASVSFSNGQLKVGEAANSDPTCVAAYEATICTAEYNPICAILNNVYVNGSNKCNFCSKYGNTAAIILQIGSPQDRKFTCAPLRIGGKPWEDPQCVNYYRSGQYEIDCTTVCTTESYPICARLANLTIVEGSNKCVFCTQYGQVDATIKAIGRACNPNDYDISIEIRK